MRSLLLAATALLWASGQANATPITFDFDGLLSGSAEQLPETSADCRPGRPCLRTTRQRVVLNKPAPSLPPVGFPDVLKTPAPPGAPVPIPYPNVSGVIQINTGRFQVPNGDTATLSVESVLETAGFVAFTIEISSMSAYSLSELTFSGLNSAGQRVEKTVVFAIPEPAPAALFLIGLVATLLARRRPD